VSLMAAASGGERILSDDAGDPETQYSCVR
jgi:hypothetical protein